MGIRINNCFLLSEVEKISTEYIATTNVQYYALFLLMQGHQVFATARQAYVLASPVPIDPTFSYKIEGKERTLTLLLHEIRSYEKSNTELK